MLKIFENCTKIFENNTEWKFPQTHTYQRDMLTYEDYVYDSKYI